MTDHLRDPVAFRAKLRIDTDAGPRPLGDCLDPWQRADFEALDASWLRSAGLSQPEAPSGLFARATQAVRRVARLPADGIPCRAYLERARGHSKSLDLAVMATFGLVAARQPRSYVWAAADRDQAKLGLDKVAALCRLNAWLGELLDVQAHRVINRRTDSALTVLSADEASSYGLTPSGGVLCDELTNWRSDGLWHSLFSAAAKCVNAVLVIISNAGCGMGDS